MTEQSSEDPPPAAVKPAKRSFFKKSSWMDARGDKIEKPLDLFSRADGFREIMQEQERRRREKLKKEQEVELQKKDKKKALKEGEKREIKRRRISDQNEDEEEGHERSQVAARRKEGMDRSKTARDLSSPIPSPTRLEKGNSNPQSLSRAYEQLTQPPANVIIDLGDSDSDDNEPPHTTPRADIIIPEDEEEEQDEDPEFRALAEKARARRRMQELEAAAANANQTLVSGLARTPSGAGTGFTPPATTTHSPPAPDAVVKILITSPIPDTSPLLVSRKLSQRLQEVRQAWCAKQGFSDDQAAGVFFTYRNRRLWDVATCKSLGIEVDSSGALRQKGDEDRFAEFDGKIHLEALTADIWEERKREREVKLAPVEEQRVDDEMEGEGAEEVVVEPSRLRLILKARGQEEFRIQVNPTTTFTELANAFRKKRGIAPDKDVFLMFDGERLEPGDKMEDSEVQDMDSIEVLIK